MENTGAKGNEIYAMYVNISACNLNLKKKENGSGYLLEQNVYWVPVSLKNWRTSWNGFI